MSPQQYARIVNLAWTEIRDRGLDAPEIAGPAISYLDANDRFVLACGDCLLGAWAVHPYDVRGNLNS
jgi:hypothetical protein